MYQYELVLALTQGNKLKVVFSLWPIQTGVLVRMFKNFFILAALAVACNADVLPEVTGVFNPSSHDQAGLQIGNRTGAGGIAFSSSSFTAPRNASWKTVLGDEKTVTMVLIDNRPVPVGDVSPGTVLFVTPSWVAEGYHELKVSRIDVVGSEFRVSTSLPFYVRASSPNIGLLESANGAPVVWNGDDYGQVNSVPNPLAAVNGRLKFAFKGTGPAPVSGNFGPAPGQVTPTGAPILLDKSVKAMTTINGIAYEGVVTVFLIPGEVDLWGFVVDIPALSARSLHGNIWLVSTNGVVTSHTFGLVLALASR